MKVGNAYALRKKEVFLSEQYKKRADERGVCSEKRIFALA